MKLRERTVWAFILAPISFGVLLFLYTSVSDQGGIGIMSVVLSAMIGYPIAVGVGIPLYAISQKLKMNGLISYGFMGLLISSVLISLFIIYPIYYEHNGDLSSLALPTRLSQMGLATLVSLFSVFIFWIIARPDQAAGSS